MGEKGPVQMHLYQVLFYRFIDLFTSHRSSKMPPCTIWLPRSHFGRILQVPLMPGFFAICHLAVSGRSILLVLEKHQTTAQGEHMKDFLMSINRLQIWRQRVSLWGNIFVPPTLDRLAALWLHQRGMLGVREKLFLERFIQPGMIVADVGANQGNFYPSLCRIGRIGHRLRVRAGTCSLRLPPEKHQEKWDRERAGLPKSSCQYAIACKAR
jgi:hypothetical protein